MIVAIAALMFLIARNLLRSRVGRALIATRDNQTSAATSGVNVAIYKTLIFGMSAAMFANVRTHKLNRDYLTPAAWI